MNEIPNLYEEIEQPLNFQTVNRVGLHSENAGEKVIPKSLVIYGYSATKYLDDVVRISLE